MSLEFGILWIEDQLEDSTRSALKTSIEKLGFKPNFEILPNSQGIEQKAQNNNLYQWCDLILLDYMLENDTGEKVAHQIRKLFPYTVILFYTASANGDEKCLRSLIAKENIEGVFCCLRGGLVDKAQTLIKNITQKSNRLSYLRGIAMKTVAECDENMRKSIKKLYLICTNKNTKSELLQHLDQKIIDQQTHQKNKYHELISNDYPDINSAQDITLGQIKISNNKHIERLEARLQERHILSTSPLNSHLNHILSKARADKAPFSLSEKQKTSIRTIKKTLSNYESEVIDPRNQLAHIFEQKGPNGWVLASDNGKATPNPLILRQNLHKHSEALEKLLTVLNQTERQESNV